MKSLSYTEALNVIAKLAKSDPFNNEYARKFAFWSKIAVKANANGKTKIADSARAKMYDMLYERKIIISNDTTGALKAVDDAAQAAH